MIACGNFGWWQLHESTSIGAAFIQFHSSRSRLLKNVHHIFLRVNLDWLYILQGVDVILQMLYLLAQ
jgi:hypothetical protein